MDPKTLAALIALGCINVFAKPAEPQGSGKGKGDEDEDDEGTDDSDDGSDDEDSGEEDSDDGDEDEDEDGEDDADGAFHPITTQDQLDRIIGSRIRKERKKYADYDDLKAENETLRGRAAESERTALLSKVAEEKGVPSNLLQGSTKEELEASADALLTFSKKTSRRAARSPSSGTGDGSTPGNTRSPSERARTFRPRKD